MILILRALGIGDLCTAVPALRGLRAAFPDDRLALAAPRWLAPLVDLTGAVDELVPVSGLAPRRWPVRGPRLAVNLHGSGPRSHRLLALAEPERLLGYACPPAGHRDGPEWNGQEHEVRRWCRLLSWYGIRSDPTDLGLARAPVRAAALAGVVPVGVTVIHPGAKAAERRWPAARFAGVATALRDAGHEVVVTGSAEDLPRARAVARRAGLPASAILAGRLDTGQLAAVVAHARLVVCGDTGVGHLATAYGTPSTLLFGPVPPGQWGPPEDRPWHQVIWHGDVPARPGEGGPHPALEAISVPEVLAAAGAALDGHSRAAAAR